eukprot:scaffold46177_cov34-Tisochrysis_lutea.AAC.1
MAPIQPGGGQCNTGSARMALEQEPIVGRAPPAVCAARDLRGSPQPSDSLPRDPGEWSFRHWQPQQPQQPPLMQSGR